MDLEINDFMVNQNPIVAKRIYIKLFELRFNESAKFEVFFYKSVEEYDMRLIKREIVELTGDDYKLWKDDDNVAIELICNKLGLTRKAHEEEKEIIIEA